jgi:hypothetical protein
MYHCTVIINGDAASGCSAERSLSDSLRPLAPADILGAGGQSLLARVRAEGRSSAGGPVCQKLEIYTSVRMLELVQNLPPTAMLSKHEAASKKECFTPYLEFISWDKNRHEGHTRAKRVVAGLFEHATLKRGCCSLCLETRRRAGASIRVRVRAWVRVRPKLAALDFLIGRAKAGSLQTNTRRTHARDGRSGRPAAACLLHPSTGPIRWPPNESRHREMAPRDGSETKCADVDAAAAVRHKHRSDVELPNDGGGAWRVPVMLAGKGAASNVQNELPRADWWCTMLPRSRASEECVVNPRCCLHAIRRGSSGRGLDRRITTSFRGRRQIVRLKPDLLRVAQPHSQNFPS